MKKITFVALAALTITACSSGPKFQVNGDISGADGKMLYLEASGLEGIAALDSVKLKGEGAFSFKQPRPESPEFYRLRIDDKVINFSVDSIETLQIKSTVCRLFNCVHHRRFRKQQQNKRANAETNRSSKECGRLASYITQQ